MIYIARFIDIVKKPKDKTPISIAKDVPPWYDGVLYPDLAPEGNKKSSYILQLNKLNVIDVVNRMLYLGKNRDPILVCDTIWQCEAVEQWLTDNGFDTEHYNKEKKE